MTSSTALAALREHICRQAENRPGIYRMLGPDRELLYVGKSIRVRSRLLSYFRAPPTRKPGEMIRQAADIEWDYVPNEFDAVVREMKLIHRWRPRYNVEHKRVIRYAFVKVTREAAPRLVPTRRVVDDGAAYFGPFPAWAWLSAAVRDLAYSLQLRDCAGATPVHFGDQLELLVSKRPPLCLRADLGSCLAPCNGSPTASEYMRRVTLARKFLEGRSLEPVRSVEARMRVAASRLDFEYAARLKDRLERLQRFRDEGVAFRGAVDGLCFVYRVPGYRGDDRLYLIRRGRIRDSLPVPRSRTERTRTVRRVEEVFGVPDTGPVGLEADEAAEILLVARWFRARQRERRRALSPELWLQRQKPKGGA